MDTTVFLVIRADRTARIVARRPRVRIDEVGIPLTLRFSDAWGKISPNAIVIDAGDPPEMTEPVSLDAKRARR